MALTTKLALSALATTTLIATAALSAPVTENGRRFTTELTGEAECSAPGVCDAGDLDGTGTATVVVNPGQGRVCWTIEVSAITLPASAAHIHIAPAGSPGPIVVPLSAPDASGDASGCIDVDRQLALDIIRKPWEYYVNVHNSDFPGGAVRGQLSRRPR